MSMDELELVSGSVRSILEKTPPGEDENGWSPSAWQRLEQAGITRVGVPEDAGGAGGGISEAAAVLYAAGRSPAPVPLAEATMVGGWLLARAGIPRPAGPFTAGRGGTAVPTEGGWMLYGDAPRVPWGRFAERAVILVTCESGPAAVLVDPGDCRILPGENLAGEPRDTLCLSGVTLPAGRARVLPASTPGELLLRGALSRVVLMAGAAERVLALSTRYAKERTQFGRAIERFQVVRHMLARIAAETAVMHAAAQVAIHAVDRDEPDWTPLAAAKVRVGRAAGEVATIAHQLHGAMGFTREHSLRRLTTRLWSWREEFGNEADWATATGEWVMNTGSDAFRLALGDDEFSGGENGPHL